MKLIGILSWFNESPSWLAATVASMSGICDHVVAVDGRYASFPDEAAVSPPEQAEAIVETAAGARLPLTLHRPAAPFYGDEVAKRNMTLALASAIGEPMKDWVLVIDADCVIIAHSEFLRHDLERCEEHAAAVGVEERLDPADDRFPLALASDVSIEDSWRTPVTLLYRLLPNLSYRGTHYSLAGEVDGQTTWLWGHDSAVQPYRAVDGLVIRHRNTERPRYRQEQSGVYYATRDRLKTEQRP